MKPRIKLLPRAGDAERFLVNGQQKYISGCLIAATGKHPLSLLGEMLKSESVRVQPH